MKKKIFICFILLTFATLSLMGCKKSNSKQDNTENNDYTNNTVVTPAVTEPVTAVPTVAEDNHEGEMRSYLTGLWVSKKTGTKRPYAYAFNNLKLVSNQWGIGQADIVYECLVEGGITRLLGIGEHYSGKRIGSTRSARHYFVSIADEYDAIYIHYGATKYARAKVKELGVDELDGNGSTGYSVFYRDPTMRAPHNAFASIAGILKGIKKNGYKTKYSDGYKSHFSFFEEDTDLENGSSAEKVSLKFSGYASPYFKYDSGDKLYYRYQYNAKHIDSNTKKQLTFKNIIIQFVKEWNIDRKGYQTMDLANASGSGFYISNGQGIPITWKKNEAKSWMRYYDKSGKELTINPGKTYIALFPKNRTDDVTIR